ncbi:hypothetical protein ACTFIV_002655 [Dictyostelium citrinum]
MTITVLKSNVQQHQQTQQEHDTSITKEFTWTFTSLISNFSIVPPVISNNISSKLLAIVFSCSIINEQQQHSSNSSNHNSSINRNTETLLFCKFQYTLNLGNPSIFTRVSKTTTEDFVNSTKITFFNSSLKNFKLLLIRRNRWIRIEILVLQIYPNRGATCNGNLDCKDRLSQL